MAQIQTKRIQWEIWRWVIANRTKYTQYTYTFNRICHAELAPYVLPTRTPLDAMEQNGWLNVIMCITLM